MSSIGPESKSPHVTEIRAHHLRFVRDLQQGQSPAQIADGWEKKVKSLRYRRFIAPPGYYEDTYGKTPKQKVAFRNGIFDLLTEIKDLEPDQPVKIILGKDKICEGCAIGTHCNKEIYKPNERGYMNVFRKVAQKRGWEEDLTVETDRNGSLSSITAPSSVVKETSTVFSFPRSALAEYKEVKYEQRVRGHFTR